MPYHVLKKEHVSDVREGSHTPLVRSYFSKNEILVVILKFQCLNLCTLPAYLGDWMCERNCKPGEKYDGLHTLFTHTVRAYRIVPSAKKGIMNQRELDHV
jgi:hypothetical protein